MQIFVYGGGVMVLFLFVIMLVNLHRLRESRMFAGTVAARRGGGRRLLVGSPRAGPSARCVRRPAIRAAGGLLRAIDGRAARATREAVAWVLFRDYLVPFEIASVFLLVAMIGAVVLGRKG